MRYVIVGEEYIEKRETSVGLYVSFLLFIQGLTSNICSSPKAPEILFVCVCNMREEIQCLLKKRG